MDNRPQVLLCPSLIQHIHHLVPLLPNSHKANTSPVQHLYSSPYTSCFNKKQPLWFFVITSANEDWFSKFFHWHISKETLCVSAIEISTSPYLCCYTTLWNLKIQNNCQTIVRSFILCGATMEAVAGMQIHSTVLRPIMTRPSAHRQRARSVCRCCLAKLSLIQEKLIFLHGI